MTEVSAAYAIQNTLAGIQTGNGGYLVTATLRGGDYTPSDFLGDGLVSLGILIAAPIVGAAVALAVRQTRALAYVASRAVTSRGLLGLELVMNVLK